MQLDQRIREMQLRRDKRKRDAIDALAARLVFDSLFLREVCLQLLESMRLMENRWAALYREAGLMPKKKAKAK